MFEIQIPQSKIQAVWRKNGYAIDILREDLNHPLIQGNKFRKLKYNLEMAQQLKSKELLTFGGAFSNHILATAAAGKAFGYKTLGIIRGEELAFKKLNSTLSQAQQFGMELHFISRADYRLKDSVPFLEKLNKKFPNSYIIPEGGTNEFAVEGCEEILDERTKAYDYICVPVGTAGTISGIIRASEDDQTILGFPALKNADFLNETIKKFTLKSNYKFVNTYHFGGYAHFSSELITFVNRFYAETKIPLDPIYTGKMMFGINDLIKKDFFSKNSRILAIHTGGLQGIEGFNETQGNLLKFAGR